MVGKRWMWKMQHMTGQREINELHVPVGVPVKLTLTSEDVIHSFFVPAFRVKQDAVPGRYTTVWFEATKAGEYHLFCAEYCGTKHSQMIGSIKVMEPAAFQAWLAGGATGVAGRRKARSSSSPWPASPAIAPTRRGAGRAWRACSGSRSTSPAAATVVADADYIRESILKPTAKVVDGLPADHADLPGAGERRRRDAARRLHPVAAAAGRGDGRAPGAGGDQDPGGRRCTGAAHAMSTHAGAPEPCGRPGAAASGAAGGPVKEPVNYLNVSYGVKSWLLTIDHKRIALLYLVSITRHVRDRRRLRDGSSAWS